MQEIISQIRILLDQLESQLQQDTQQRPESKSPADPLESAYQLYPRKIGKKLGMQRLRKLSPSKLPEVRAAILNYRNYCISQDTEDRYMMHFSTFALRWEDWVEPPTVINTSQERQRIQKEKREQQRSTRQREQSPPLTEEEKKSRQEDLRRLAKDLSSTLKA